LGGRRAHRGLRAHPCAMPPIRDRTPGPGPRCPRPSRTARCPATASRGSRVPSRHPVLRRSARLPLERLRCLPRHRLAGTEATTMSCAPKTSLSLTWDSTRSAAWATSTLKCSSVLPSGVLRVGGSPFSELGGGNASRTLGEKRV
jgi:hypothetical protein